MSGRRAAAVLLCASLLAAAAGGSGARGAAAGEAAGKPGKAPGDPAAAKARGEAPGPATAAGGKKEPGERGRSSAGGDPPVPGAERRPSLVPDGGFESGGKDGPRGWQLPDGLTVTWVAAPGRRGKCIRIDTDVLSSQFRKREDEMEAARAAGRPPPPPPKKLPTSPPKYDTVAGNDGVHFGSDPIPIEPRKRYLLEVDVRVDGSGSPKVWAKAYGTVAGEVTRRRELWKKGLDCNGAGPSWKTFRMVFPRGGGFPAAATELRLYLYPYWPPAVYYFDDVRLVEVSEEEARAFAEAKGLAEPGGK